MPRNCMSKNETLAFVSRLRGHVRLDSRECVPTVGQISAAMALVRALAVEDFDRVVFNESNGYIVVTWAVERHRKLHEFVAFKPFSTLTINVKNAATAEYFVFWSDGNKVGSAEFSLAGDSVVPPALQELVGSIRFVRAPHAV